MGQLLGNRVASVIPDPLGLTRWLHLASSGNTKNEDLTTSLRESQWEYNQESVGEGGDCVPSESNLELILKILSPSLAAASMIVGIILNHYLSRRPHNPGEITVTIRPNDGRTSTTQPVEVRPRLFRKRVGVFRRKSKPARRRCYALGCRLRTVFPLWRGRPEPSKRRIPHNARLALRLGILSVPLPILAVPAIVVGARALREIRAGSGELEGRPHARAGVVLGSFMLFVLFALGALA